MLRHLCRAVLCTKDKRRVSRDVQTVTHEVAAHSRTSPVCRHCFQGGHPRPGGLPLHLHGNQDQVQESHHHRTSRPSRRAAVFPQHRDRRRLHGHLCQQACPCSPTTTSTASCSFPTCCTNPARCARLLFAPHILPLSVTPSERCQRQSACRKKLPLPPHLFPI